MAKKPGNLNPDSTAGNARLGIGRGSNAGRSQASGANKAVPAPKKFSPPVSTGQRAADLFSKGSKIAEARAKAQLKAAGLDVKTGLPVDKAASARLRAQGAAYRESLSSNRVKALESKLNFPKKAKVETKAALNKRLNKTFNTMFDYSKIVGKKAK